MGYKELAEGWLAKKEKEFGSLLTTANEAVKIAPTTVEQLNEAIEKSMAAVNKALVLAHEIEMEKLRIKETK